MTQPTEEFVLRLTAPPNCPPPCGRPGLLSARFPNSWKNTRGEEVHGLREAVLCPECDRGEPPADALLALFAVDDQIAGSNAEVFSRLVTAWVESVRHRTVDLTLLNAEVQRWQKGSL
ncbi:DUF6300 family protein [Streptomyces sp. NPDC088124]|uniref:DUF6300 family protein n=1 Tax=Streptomyces sp. NPDC088124 TaxID=3154654 RepID=UPI0034245131